MQKSQPIQENDLVLLVLRRTDTQKVEVVKIQLENPKSDVYQLVLERVRNALIYHTESSDEIFRIMNDLNNTIDSFNMFNIDYSYCDRLSEPYQYHNTLHLYEIITKEHITKTFPEGMVEHQRLLALKDIVIQSEKAYRFKLGYNLVKDQTTTIAYSHRMIGWTFPEYKFDKNLSFQFKTNFGFGNSSYFLLKMHYCDIPIIPYSQWVNYRYQDSHEILRYTQSYGVSYSQWYDALNYSSNAIHQYLSNEQQFINDFIINEIETMVSGIQRFLSTDRFELTDWHGVTYPKLLSLHYKGYKLLEFRGEKITGSIDFIEAISKLKAIRSVDEYIDKIDSCCKEVYGMLKQEIKNIKADIKELKIKISEIEPTHEEVSEYYFSLNQPPDGVKNMFTDLPCTNTSAFIDTVNERLVEFEKLREDYKKAELAYLEISKLYNPLVNRRGAYETYLDKFKDYKTKLENYFNGTLQLNN